MKKQKKFRVTYGKYQIYVTARDNIEALQLASADYHQFHRDRFWIPDVAIEEAQDQI
jgi:hypothetical protein